MYEVTISFIFDSEEDANLTAEEAWSAGAVDVTVQEVGK